MLDNLTFAFAAMVAGAMNALFGAIAIRRVDHLEQKLAVLRRVIFVQGLALGLVWLGVILGAGQAPKLSPVREVGVEQLRDHLVAWQQHQNGMWLAMASMPFLLITLLPIVLQVVRELRSFVLAQRIDLAARDQAALWGGAKPGPEPVAKP